VGALTLASQQFGGRCLLVFTSAFRADDYVRTQLATGPPIQYLSSSSLEAFRMVTSMREADVGALAIDRCPRCGVCSMTAMKPVRIPRDLVILWSINKAIEFTRAEMCVEYALKAAREGELRVARDVLLEAVGHVTPDDPRLHFLLGQVAIASEDARLLG
jgi:hypothetical protein